MEEMETLEGAERETPVARCKCRSSSIHSPIVCPWTVPKLDCFKAADKLFVGLRTTYRGRGGQHRGMCYCTALSFCFHRSPSLLILQLQLLSTAHRTPAARSQTFIGLKHESVQKHLRLLVVFDQYRNEVAQHWPL